MRASRAQARAWQQAAGVALPKPKKRGMNQWEREYANVLRRGVDMGEYQWFAFEAVRLRLADGTYFKPDFCVVEADGTIRFDEVKGHMREAARIRLRVAAELYPWRFVIVRKVKGGWTFDEVPGKRP